jgi:CrcB protein
MLVTLGAVVGAPLRFLTDRWIQARHDSVFPWGTFVINVTGSLLLGLILGGASKGHVSHAAVLALGIGFCGTLTTFSTFVWESFRLTAARARSIAWLNLLGSTASSLAAAALGWQAAGLLR